MRIYAPLVLSLVSLLASAGHAAAQPPAQPPAPAAVAAPAAAYPLGVQLMTLVDHPAVLARQVVQLPPTEVKRVLAPGLVVVGDPRQHANYHFYASNQYDRVLVLLPSAAALARGDLVVVTGTVRTVAGARLTGDLRGVPDDVLKRHARGTLLVARGVTTTDAVSVLQPR